MTGIGKLLHKIGDFFTNLFHSAEKLWDKVPPDLQEALMQGSEFVNIINTNLDETPDFIFELLQQKYPNLTKEELHGYLTKALEGTAIAHEVTNQNLEQTIVALQTYLGSLSGTTWAKISGLIAQGYAAAKAPSGTKWAAIASLINFVYHAFIKKN